MCLDPLYETKVFPSAMASSLKVLTLSALPQTLAITADALDGEWWKIYEKLFPHSRITEYASKLSIPL